MIVHDQSFGATRSTACLAVLLASFAGAVRAPAEAPFDPRAIPAEKRLAYVNDLIQTPEAENAAPLYAQALAKLVTLPDSVPVPSSGQEAIEAAYQTRSKLLNNDRAYPLRTDWPADEAALVNQWLKDQAAVLELLEKAAQRREWDPTYTSSTWRLAGLDLSFTRMLKFGRLIGTQANACAIAGDWETAYRWNLIGYVISRQMRRSPWQIAQLIGANIERDALQQFRAFLGRQAPSEVGECWQAYVAQHERAFDNAISDRTERLYGWDYTESIYQWATGDPNYTHVESLLEMYVQRASTLPGGAEEPRPLYKDLDELGKAIRASSLDKAWNVERELNAMAEAWDARPFHEAWPGVEEFRGRYGAIAQREPVAALMSGGSLMGVGQTRLPLTTRDAAFHGTALVVACHLYRSKHGRFPSDLAALAPEFIKEVPDDPCSGRPFVYQPAADGATFKLYGLGPNQKDDGDREEPTTNLNQGDWVFWPVSLPEWQTPSWSQPAAP